MPWVEFKIGRDRKSSHFIRTESIIKLISHTGEYSLSTGVCVLGQDDPTWVNEPPCEVIYLIERAERGANRGGPEAPPSETEPPTSAPSSDDPDSDIPF